MTKLFSSQPLNPIQRAIPGVEVDPDVELARTKFLLPQYREQAVAKMGEEVFGKEDFLGMSKGVDEWNYGKLREMAHNKADEEEAHILTKDMSNNFWSLEGNPDWKDFSLVEHPPHIKGGRDVQNWYRKEQAKMEGFEEHGHFSGGFVRYHNPPGESGRPTREQFLDAEKKYGTIDLKRPSIPWGEGSYATEQSITITNPRLNNGKPTNIPSIWNGQPMSEEDSVSHAIEAEKAGQVFKSFDTIEEASANAAERSEFLEKLRLGQNPSAETLNKWGQEYLEYNKRYRQDFELAPLKYHRRETEESPLKEYQLELRRLKYYDGKMDPATLSQLMDDAKEKFGMRVSDRSRQVQEGLSQWVAASQNEIENSGSTFGKRLHRANLAATRAWLPMVSAYYQLTGDSEMASIADEAGEDPSLSFANEDLLDTAITFTSGIAPFLAITTGPALAGVGLAPMWAYGFAMAGLIEGNAEYQNALRDGWDKKKAAQHGWGVGAASGLIEVFWRGGGAKYLKSFKKGTAQKGGLKQYYKDRAIEAFKVGGREGLEEVFQQNAQFVSKYWRKDPEILDSDGTINWEQWRAQTIEAGVGGFFGGQLFGMVMHARTGGDFRQLRGMYKYWNAHHDVAAQAIKVQGEHLKAVDPDYDTRKLGLSDAQEEVYWGNTMTDIEDIRQQNPDQWDYENMTEEERKVRFKENNRTIQRVMQMNYLRVRQLDPKNIDDVVNGSVVVPNKDNDGSTIEFPGGARLSVVYDPELNNEALEFEDRALRGAFEPGVAVGDTILGQDGVERKVDGQVRLNPDRYKGARGDTLVHEITHAFMLQLLAKQDSKLLSKGFRLRYGYKGEKSFQETIAKTSEKRYLDRYTPYGRAAQRVLDITARIPFINKTVFGRERLASRWLEEESGVRRNLFKQKLNPEDYRVTEDQYSEFDKMFILEGFEAAMDKDLAENIAPDIHVKRRDPWPSARSREMHRKDVLDLAKKKRRKLTEDEVETEIQARIDLNKSGERVYPGGEDFESLIDPDTKLRLGDAEVTLFPRTRRQKLGDVRRLEKRLKGAAYKRWAKQAAKRASSTDFDKLQREFAIKDRPLSEINRAQARIRLGQESLPFKDSLYQSEPIRNLSQRGAIVDPFFLKSLDVVDRHMSPKSPLNPLSLKNLLSRYGVTKEEMRWLDINGLVEANAKRKISKKEVQDWINAHTLIVHEEELYPIHGERSLDYREYNKNLSEKRKALGKLPITDPSGKPKLFATRKFPDYGYPSDLQYEGYTEAGGTNYKIFVLGVSGKTLGERAPTGHFDPETFGRDDPDRREDWGLSASDPKEVLKDGQDPFSTLVHIRTKDRIGPGDIKVLFIEEFQSDLIQKLTKALIGSDPEKLQRNLEVAQGRDRDALNDLSPAISEFNKQFDGIFRLINLEQMSEAELKDYETKHGSPPRVRHTKLRVEMTQLEENKPDQTSYEISYNDFLRMTQEWMDLAAGDQTDSERYREALGEPNDGWQLHDDGLPSQEFGGTDWEDFDTRPEIDEAEERRSRFDKGPTPDDHRWVETSPKQQRLEEINAEIHKQLKLDTEERRRGFPSWTFAFGEVRKGLEKKKETGEELEAAKKAVDVGLAAGILPEDVERAEKGYPFFDSIHQFALKRMLRYAAENDYEALALSTADQQIKRYDLEKHRTKKELEKSAFRVHYDRLAPGFLKNYIKRNKWNTKLDWMKLHFTNDQLPLGDHPEYGPIDEIPADPADPFVGMYADDPETESYGKRQYTGNVPAVTISSDMKKNLLEEPQSFFQSEPYEVVYGPIDKRRGDTPYYRPGDVLEPDDDIFAYADTKTRTLYIDQDRLQKKFDKKVWTKPKVRGTEPLPANMFKTVEEFGRFVLEHEKAHLWIRPSFDESRGNYENRINQAALLAMGIDHTIILPPEAEDYQSLDQTNLGEIFDDFMGPGRLFQSEPYKGDVKVKKTLPMDFSFGGPETLNRAFGIQSRTTFGAILEGKRTATSRKDGSLRNLGVGDRVRFTRDDRQVIVIVTGKREAHSLSPAEWARAEGYDIFEATDNWTKKKNFSQYTQILFEVDWENNPGLHSYIPLREKLRSEKESSKERIFDQTPKISKMSEYRTLEEIKNPDMTREQKEELEQLSAEREDAVPVSDVKTQIEKNRALGRLEDDALSQGHNVMDLDNEYVSNEQGRFWPENAPDSEIHLTRNRWDELNAEKLRPLWNRRSETEKRYTPQLLRQNPGKAYLFGDNLEQQGKGGQAVVRDEPNAYGIPTKKKPSFLEDAFFTDKEYADNIEAIDNAIDQIPKNKTIVFPKDGLGTGRAKLKSKAPKTWEYLQKRLDELRRTHSSIELYQQNDITKRVGDDVARLMTDRFGPDWPLMLEVGIPEVQAAQGNALKEKSNQIIDKSLFRPGLPPKKIGTTKNKPRDPHLPFIIYPKDVPLVHKIDFPDKKSRDKILSERHIQARLLEQEKRQKANLIKVMANPVSPAQEKWAMGEFQRGTIDRNIFDIQQKIAWLDAALGGQWTHEQEVTFSNERIKQRLERLGVKEGVPDKVIADRKELAIRTTIDQLNAEIQNITKEAEGRQSERQARDPGRSTRLSFTRKERETISDNREKLFSKEKELKTLSFLSEKHRSQDFLRGIQGYESKVGEIADEKNEFQNVHIDKELSGKNSTQLLELILRDMDRAYREAVPEEVIKELPFADLNIRARWQNIDPSSELGKVQAKFLREMILNYAQKWRSENDQSIMNEMAWSRKMAQQGGDREDMERRVEKMRKALASDLDLSDNLSKKFDQLRSIYDENATMEQLINKVAELPEGQRKRLLRELEPRMWDVTIDDKNNNLFKFLFGKNPFWYQAEPYLTEADALAFNASWEKAWVHFIGGWQAEELKIEQTFREFERFMTHFFGDEKTKKKDDPIYPKTDTERDRWYVAMGLWMDMQRHPEMASFEEDVRKRVDLLQSKSLAAMEKHELDHLRIIKDGFILARELDSPEKGSVADSMRNFIEEKLKPETHRVYEIAAQAGIFDPFQQLDEAPEINVDKLAEHMKYYFPHLYESRYESTKYPVEIAFGTKTPRAKKRVFKGGVAQAALNGHYMKHWDLLNLTKEALTQTMRATAQRGFIQMGLVNKLLVTSPTNGYEKLKHSGAVIWRNTGSIVGMKFNSVQLLELTGESGWEFGRLTKHDVRYDKEGYLIAEFTASKSEGDLGRAKRTNQNFEIRVVDLADKFKADGPVIGSNGMVYSPNPIYAPAGVAKRFNNIMLTNPMRQYEWFNKVLTWNSVLKMNKLLGSLFHQWAFVRSYALGGVFNDPRFVKRAYEDGKKLVRGFHPLLEEGVRHGLTLFRIQDFDRELAFQDFGIGKFIGSKSDKAGKAFDWLVDKRDRYNRYLFGIFGSSLKAMAYLGEYRQLLLKEAERLLKEDLDSLDDSLDSVSIMAARKTNEVYDKMIDDINNLKAKVGQVNPGFVDRAATTAAELMNRDFGGVNTERMGVSQSSTDIMRILFLGPDWTSSNVLSAFGGAKWFNKLTKGHLYVGTDPELMTQAHRRFWLRIAVRSILVTAIGNLLMAGLDDDDSFDRFKKAWSAGNFRWLGVDISPLYHLFGGDPEISKYASIPGHFIDPMKFLFHPGDSFFYKSSSILRPVLTALKGQNYKKETFTNFWELPALGPTSWWSENNAGGISISQLPSWLLHTLGEQIPIPLQGLILLVSGELDGFDAFARTIGATTQTTYINERKRAN